MEVTIEGKAYIDADFVDCCIGIEDGRISAIKKILKGDLHYKFNSKLILPAGIDIHVHFRDPGMTYKEDFSTGSLAAAFGGVSCVFDMPNTIPQTTSLQTLSNKIISADKKAYVDFGVYVGITDSNVDNIERLYKKCSGFKIFMGNTTNSLNLDENNLKQAFKKINSTSKPVLIHAEDITCLNMHKMWENNLIDHLRSRPAACEENSIKSILKTAKDCSNVRIHICHLSSFGGLDVLKNRSKNISVGVTPHHLLLSVDKNLKSQTLYKVNPPIRTSFDRDALFEGVKNGFVDILESDHAPHTLEDKAGEFNSAPSGNPGVETVFPLFLFLAKKGKLSFQRLVTLFCENPANLLGVSKGKIEVGRDADFVIVDLKGKCKVNSEKLHSKCGWSLFDGWPAIFPTCVFIRGVKLIEEHEIQVKQGFGRFVGDKT
ncbi:MAG: dihydroorotase [Thermoplasmatales archaeon]|nr:MAG: dihydroorotase [Thermoplasmatales archaeon]